MKIYSVDLNIQCRITGTITVNEPNKGEAVKMLILNQEGTETDMDILEPGTSATYDVMPVDADGNESEVEGIPVYTVTPEGGVKLTPAEDGKSFQVEWLAPMDQIITVTGNANMTGGITLIYGDLGLRTMSVPNEAVGFVITKRTK